MDAFWPEFEKRGYKTVRAFTDQSNFSDDELKEMGMGKVKIQYFRRVLKKNAAQNFLSFTQGLLSDDEDAKPTAPDEKFTPMAHCLVHLRMYLPRQRPIRIRRLLALQAALAIHCLGRMMLSL